MLTAYDEHFCHQTPTTFDHVADSSEYWRENQWACIYDESGKIFISAVFGVSPNRNVMDSSAQLTIDGKTQYTIGASRELRPNNADIKVGPMEYQVIEGLHSVRWLLAENEYGISWDITFEASVPISVAAYPTLPLKTALPRIWQTNKLNLSLFLAPSS
jgi:hypothetical protein